ncbi:molybdenum cofactor guanylyltransferase MobA [Tahibacter harae]|uniref:Molybdenum cofactor guanylyltransferase n=1 Tax=Tahibacter harae TaxID=2963937 RepID=A0ABT1QVV4_9GAMM|nr:molybdenum cofactor guanylyltransferase MobA [Tahibacter harae]MCQ4166412.1 molybdenum cofactor guanylyltransferase [Tahibacter harae]
MADPARSASLAAAILAGGAARRLGGVDKGLALLQGRPLIAWVTAAIAPQVDGILILANRHADEYARYGRVCADRRPGFRGPLEGIATALGECRSEWLLTVPVDSPAPGADLVRQLWQRRGDAAVVVAHDGLRRQPLFALYHCARVVPPGLDEDPQRPVWRWQDSYSCTEVDFSASAGRFANLNTAQDFRDAAL